MILASSDRNPSKSRARCSARWTHRILPHFEGGLCALSSFAIMAHRTELVAHRLQRRFRAFKKNLSRQSFLKVPSCWRPYKKARICSVSIRSMLRFRARYSDLCASTRAGDRWDRWLWALKRIFDCMAVASRSACIECLMI